MGKPGNTISALLITFNEEKNIDEVLENLSFANEIIVVDSYSTDSTFQKVKEHKDVKLIQREFKNYTDQKGFALTQANNDWVLFLDADERVTPALRKEILEATQANKPEISAYYFLRQFMFQKKPLKFSGWQTDKNYRLFRKSKVCFDPNKIVHETLIVDGESATLKNKLIHFSYSTYQDYKRKMVKYGEMKAVEEVKKGKKAMFYHFLFRPFYKFFNNYFLRLGILDGKQGIIICYLNALGVYSRYNKMRELNKKD